MAYNRNMPDYIDEHFWREALSKPTWYLLLKDDFARLEKLAAKEPDYTKRKQIKRQAYGLIEEAVRDGWMPLAETGENLDVERKSIDTIVIHHTKNRPGMTLDRLNAIQLLRIYGGHYANPVKPSEAHFKGQPVWSGHFHNSKQVFWGYHWFVREDGSCERLLDDTCVGWHSGNWDVNTRSIGICVDDDLSDKEPSEAVVDGIAGIILQHYAPASQLEILAHCQVNTTTSCPGHLFLESWKQKLTTRLV